MSRTPDFAHLHVHTEYSLLDGACRIDKLVGRVKELGMDSIAVTDHGVMTGLYKLQAAAQREGIKPIFGCELYFAEDRTVRDPKNRYYHLTALAETTEGLHNLYRMNLRAAQEGMYYGKPRVDYELLKEYGEGVIILSGCLAGRTMQSLANTDLEPDPKKRMHAARDELIRLSDCVGKDNLYVEVQNSGVADWDSSQWEWNGQLQALAQDLGLLTVGTSDTHYLTADEKAGPRVGDPWHHDTLLCVQTRGLKDQPLNERMSLVHDWDNPHYYHLRSVEEMKKTLENVPESIPNTLLVAERCNAEIRTGRTFEMLPDFPVPEDYTPPAGQPEGMDDKVWTQQSFLREKIWEGLHRRYGSPLPAEVVERAEYELEVINKMGTTSYFLITWDWIRYAKEIGMVIGPGRGSGAGSIVLYALDVTQLCPLEHKLLFERFLSPERISMPDVDTDAAPVGDADYDKVRQYLRDKYGEENCAQIITFQTIGGKAGIRSAARAFGPELLPLADRMSKAVPMNGQVPVPLPQALDEGVELKQAIASGGSEAQKIIDAALWMEGLISAESVHAAAFVISPIPLTDALPVQLNKDGFPVTAFAMGEAESVGCLKLDLLGLRNLSILADAQRLIKKYQDVDVDVINYQVPMDDAKTYEMLARGESVGVFQFECLAGDTIINGDPRTTISDLYANPPEHLLSVDMGDGVRRRNRVLQVVRSGRKQLHRLTTDSGYTLRASADHKILTREGWKRLEDLTRDDAVLVNTRDASRIGACRDCGVQIKSRGARCKRCANIHRGSGQLMSRNRDAEQWKASLPRGKEHFWWGKAPATAGRAYHAPDLPHSVRSHWEADFARAMIALKIPYQYEPRTFELKAGDAYTPDFYLPDHDLWVEVACRGGKSGRAKQKIDRFRAEYPDMRLEVVRGHQIAEFEIANPRLAAWDCPQLPQHFAFDAVKSVVLDQVEMTYDIAMEAPLNNYVANGIVVHNSGGMQDTLRAVGTTEFNDLVAIVAAYRPGAMEQIPVYARRKKGLEKVEYGDPRMEEILAETYGNILYQEQAMLLSRDLAGFTGGLMDTLRKAIGKKLMDKMMELKPIFFNGTVVEKDGEEIVVPGALKNGVDKKTAEWVWSVFEASASYSFNKSHAAAYALISYVTAYLKANYPTEYMAALLTSVMHTKDKVPFYLYETKRMGIEVLPPSVNESFSQFEPSGDNAIRFGLTAVKGVGEQVVENIVAEREAGGAFKNLWDFAQRVDGINRREVDNLIKAGAFDFSGDSRQGMLEVSEQMLKQSKKIRQKKSEGQDSLFDSMSAEAELAALQVDDSPTIPKDDFTEEEKFALEREVTGLYVSGHPLESARAAWERVRHLGVGEISEEHLSDHNDQPTVVTVAGVITGKRAVYTKRDNKRMLIIQLEDLTGNAEIVVFPKLVEEGAEAHLQEGGMAYLRVALEEDTRGFSRGDEDEEDGAARQVKLIARVVGPFNPEAIDVPEFYDVSLPQAALTREVMSAVVDTLKSNPGDQAVRLLLLDDAGHQVASHVFPPELKVAPSESLGEALRAAVGL